MYIRTNSNIYEINKDDIIIENKKITGYYIGETEVIKEEQVIAKTENGIEDLVDCFVLYVDGIYYYSDSDLVAVESLAMKFMDRQIEIYGMIFTRSRFNNEVKAKVIVKHSVDENGYGYYGLVKEHVINLWNKKE